MEVFHLGINDQIQTILNENKKRINVLEKENRDLKGVNDSLLKGNSALMKEVEELRSEVIRVRRQEESMKLSCQEMIGNLTLGANLVGGSKEELVAMALMKMEMNLSGKNDSLYQRGQTETSERRNDCQEQSGASGASGLSRSGIIEAAVSEAAIQSLDANISVPISGSSQMQSQSQSHHNLSIPSFSLPHQAHQQEQEQQAQSQQQPNTNNNNNSSHSSALKIHLDDQSWKINYTLIKTSGRYLCNVCATQLKDIYFFKRHYYMIHSRSLLPYKCDWQSCDFASYESGDLIDHKRKHTGEKPYICDWPGCDFRTHAKKYLSKHFDRHTDKFVCKYCSKKLKNFVNLRTHIEMVHRKEYQLLKCKHCFKKFKSNFEYQSHMRSHRRTPMFRCAEENCGKEYSSREALKYHNKTVHAPEKHCAWPGCLFTTKYPSTLKAHIGEHTGELPFACKECGNKFKNRDAVKIHRNKEHKVK